MPSVDDLLGPAPKPSADAMLGPTPDNRPVKTPNWWERTGIARPGSPVAEHGLIGAIEMVPGEIANWWHSTPSALEQSRTIREKQAAADRAWEAQTGTKLEPEQHSPEAWDLALTNPLVGAFGPGEGIVRGFGAGKNAAVDVLGGTAKAKPGPEIGATAAIEGTVPKPEDFDAAATALVGPKDAPDVSKKLRLTYEQTGITPAGVVADAAKDPTIAQDLVSTDAGVPARYGSLVRHGQPPEPPPPGGELPPPPEQPALPPPPPEGSVEDAEAKILSKIVVGDTKERAPLSFERLYTLVVDDLNPLRQAVKERGKPLAPGDDPYQLARLTRGTFGKADQFLEFAPFDFNTYENVGPSLRKILDPVKDDLNGLRAYVASKRAIELQGRDIDSGFDIGAAATVAGDKARRARYEPILRALNDYQNSLTRYLRDSGVLSRAAYEKMLEANKEYVPFFRLMSDQTAGGPRSGRSLQAKNPLKKIKGSERDVIDPIESIIKNTYTYIALAEKNAVGTKFADMMGHAIKMEAGGAPVPEQISGLPATVQQPREFELLPPPDKGAAIATREATDAVVEFLGAHGVTDIPDDLAAVWHYAMDPAKSDRITVFRDGKRFDYQVDPEVARAFKGLDAESANLLLKIIAVPAKALRAGAVLTPDFMARNLIRDFLTAFVNSKGVFSPIDTAKGFAGVIRKDADFQNWLKAGGANSAMVSLDRRYLSQHLFKLSRETGLMLRAWNVVKSPLDGLRLVSELTENATRLGEFKKLAGGGAPKGRLQAAAFASREVTLDFARIGASMRAFNMISAFANAQIQGVDRTIRAFAERPVSTTLKVAGGITLPSILLWSANHDDPRYKALPDWEKDLFWIVLTKDHIWRIPKPFELGVIFGSGVERVLDAFFDGSAQALGKFMHSAVEALLPSVTPTIAIPLVEQFANRSTFTGNTLVPDRLERLLPEYQYKPYTTEAAKAIGRLVGAFPGMEKAAVENNGMLGATARALTTPILIENYVRAWSGGLGMYMMLLADKGLRETGVLPDPVKPTPTLADIPFVKAFAVRYPSGSAQPIQDFYDRYETGQKYRATFLAKAQEGDAEAMQHVTELGGARVFTQLDGLHDTISQHAQLIRMIYKNPEITADEKRQLIDELYYNMIQLAESGNSTLDRIESAVAPALP